MNRRDTETGLTVPASRALVLGANFAAFASCVDTPDFEGALEHLQRIAALDSATPH